MFLRISLYERPHLSKRNILGMAQTYQPSQVLEN